MKTIYTLLIMTIGLSTAAYGQKKAGTAIPSMGSAYLKKEKDQKSASIVAEAFKKKTPGTYYGSTKTATVITDAGKTYTIAHNTDEEKMLEDGHVAYTNNSKDTLFILNSHLGKMIKEVWDIDTKFAGKKPVICMVPSITAVITARKSKSITDKKLLKN